MKIEFVWPRDVAAQLRELKEILMATQAENQARIEALAGNINALGTGLRKVAAEIRHLKTAYEQGQELDWTPADAALSDTEAALADADALNDDLVDPETPAEGEEPAATE